MCCEPVLSVSADGTLIPVLAAEVPSTNNGGLSADGRTVTYGLKKGRQMGGWPAIHSQ
jgi:peptide/nickel transport system substrate-binding protein